MFLKSSTRGPGWAVDLPIQLGAELADCTYQMQLIEVKRSMLADLQCLSVVNHMVTLRHPFAPQCLLPSFCHKPANFLCAPSNVSPHLSVHVIRLQLFSKS